MKQNNSNSIGLSMEQIRMYIENGIYYSKIEAEIIIDIEDAKEILERRIKLFEGKTYPGYFEISKLKYESKQARDFLAKHGSEGISASAIIADSTFSKFFISVFLNIYPPSMPTKVFDNQSKAVDWLQQFVNNN